MDNIKPYLGIFLYIGLLLLTPKGCCEMSDEYCMNVVTLW